MTKKIKKSDLLKEGTIEEILKRKIMQIKNILDQNFIKEIKLENFLLNSYRELQKTNWNLKKINFWNAKIEEIFENILKKENFKIMNKIFSIILSYFNLNFPTTYGKMLRLLFPFFSLIKKNEKFRKLIFEDIYLFLQKLYFYFNPRDQKLMLAILKKQLPFIKTKKNNFNNFFSLYEKPSEKHNTKKEKTLFKKICEKYSKNPKLQNLTKIYPICFYINSSLKKNFFNNLDKLYFEDLKKKKLFSSRKKIIKRKNISAFSSPIKLKKTRRIKTPLKTYEKKFENKKMDFFINKKVTFHEYDNSVKNFDKNQTVSEISKF